LIRAFFLLLILPGDGLMNWSSYLLLLVLQFRRSTTTRRRSCPTRSSITSRRSSCGKGAALSCWVSVFS
jgi:hypothetical protein